MPESNKKGPGSVIWRDLTVSNAGEISRFYSEVVGWRAEPVSMGNYNDYNMVSDSGEVQAGICHTAGTNINLPDQWLIYITVKNIGHSVDRCLHLGGKVIDGPRKMGENDFCVIQDPAGAYAALITE